MTIQWSASRRDAALISGIAVRSIDLIGAPYQDIEMDITACHLNGCPLKLEALLHADDFNFVHDVQGIHQHLDRETGELKDCFLPRFHA
ncbi:MAG: DUF6874 family protein [Bellilinea sp.]